MTAQQSIQEIFMDFAFRRYAIINALTWTFESFYAACDPKKEELCLYGCPSGKWMVKAPRKLVPNPVPLPRSGINKIRDMLSRKTWISYVAACSDAWLLSLAFHFADIAFLDKRERARLFEKMNELPTIREVMRDRMAREKRERGSVNEEDQDKGNIEDESGDKRGEVVMQEIAAEEGLEHESTEEDKSDEEEELCGKCGEGELFDDEWVRCDECWEWFHGKCGQMRRYKKKVKCIGCRKRKQS